MTAPYTGPRTIRVLDFETTGKDDEPEAEVVEMGRVDFDVTACTIGNPWQSLCKPSAAIPPATRAVHHISDAMVADAPPARELWVDFLGETGGPIVYAAHNAKFEKHFVPPDYREAQWIDTYKVALLAWPDAPGHSNQVLRYWLGVDNLPDFDPARADPPHRALPDAYVTAFILRELLDVKTVEEMVTISSYPAVLRRMNFGQHRGMLFADAPADYLEWLLGSKMGEDVKFTAKRELQIRRRAK